MTTSRPRKTRPVGTISLVAAGPGDPELLTVRATNLLAAADAVVADSDVVDIATRYAPDAELIPVVDEDGLPLDHPARAKKVIEAARASKDVVRLFSGDPLLDGAIAAEANVLNRSKLPFEVAPGVSQISGVAGYAGFPLTSAKAREVRIVEVDSVEDWAELADPRFTVIVRDGADSAVEISKALIAAGRHPNTPIAITRGATTVEQRTIATTLAELPAVVKASKQAGPGVVVIGDVLNSRDKLSWFETKPLFGWRVLVPRTKDQAGALSEHLRRYGAVPVEVPTISVEPPRTPQQMDRAIQGLVTGRYSGWRSPAPTQSRRSERSSKSTDSTRARWPV